MPGGQSHGAVGVGYPIVVFFELLQRRISALFKSASLLYSVMRTSVPAKQSQSVELDHLVDADDVEVVHPFP